MFQFNPPQITKEIAKKYFPYVIIGILIILMIVLVASAFVLREKCLLPELQPKISNPQEDFEAGGIGEVMVKDDGTGLEVPLVTSDIPSVMHNTTGVIVEIKKDRIIVQGRGTNFADGLSRIISVFYTDDTITFDGSNQALRWIGAVGLRKLELGEEILIGTSENIRGKTEFFAKTINVI